MGTDSFDKYNYKVEGLVCSKPDGYQVWLGYRTEIFSLRDWTRYYNWDEDEWHQIEESNLYKKDYPITFEVFGHMPEDNFFIKWDCLKVSIVEDGGWKSDLASAPTAYHRQQYKKTFREFIRETIEKPEPRLDDWTWLTREY